MEEQIAELRKKHFGHLKPDFCHLNNGSFGTAPTCVLQKDNEFRMQWYSQPALYLYDMKTGIWDGIKKSLYALAPLINCEQPYEDHLCLQDNLTSAANTVIKAVSWKFWSGAYQRGDSVVISNFTYGAVANSVRHYIGDAGGDIVTVNYPFPIVETDLGAAKEVLLKTFRDRLDSISGKIRLVVLDHISSMPSIVYPTKEMISICRQRGVDTVFVDGAHALGNVPIDVQYLGADFYASNCHKWFFNPASTVFLHSKVPFSQMLPLKPTDKQLALHHPLVGWQYNEGMFLECYVGTRDYSSLLCVSAAADFAQTIIKDLLPESIHPFRDLMKYNSATCLNVCQMLASAWHSIVALPSDLSCAMVMVALPKTIPIASDDQAKEFRGLLAQKYSIDIPAGFWPKSTVPEFKAFVRVSHQIYNLEAEYDKLRDAVLDICSQLNREPRETLQALVGDSTFMDNLSVSDKKQVREELFEHE